jgi:hypothetical protein
LKVSYSPSTLIRIQCPAGRKDHRSDLYWCYYKSRGYIWSLDFHFPTLTQNFLMFSSFCLFSSIFHRGNIKIFKVIIHLLPLICYIVIKQLSFYMCMCEELIDFLHFKNLSICLQLLC